MKIYDNDGLSQYLRRKGIKFRKGEYKIFGQFDYFQVVNGYKALFISGIETIDKIMENINNSVDVERYRKNFLTPSYSSIDDLKNKVCNRIIERYDLDCSKTASLVDKISKIKSINYVHHIYKDDSYYSDFVRMYKFEHALRSVLLKYTLIIEENLKRIFISVLNKEPDIKANFLTNIDNYDTTINSKSNDNAINCLKKILELHNNKESKPIQRKRNQDIIVPYWILINEMTLNQTLNTIKNIKSDIRLKVQQECVNRLSNASYDIFDSKKTANQIKTEKKGIKIFMHVLDYIGGFRNMLAHNQPIYMYNIDNCDLSKFPVLSYRNPTVRNNPAILEQRKINTSTMEKMQHFFGLDVFNSRTRNVDIKLDFIIYLIYKINNHLDGNTNYLKEIKELYYSYNVVLDDDEYDYIGINNQLDELKKFLQNKENVNNSASDIIRNIAENKAYAKDLKGDYSIFKGNLQKIEAIVSKITKKTKTRKYINTFPNNDEYSKLTGIDKYYLNNIG